MTTTHLTGGAYLLVEKNADIIASEPNRLVGQSVRLTRTVLELAATYRRHPTTENGLVLIEEVIDIIDQCAWEQATAICGLAALSALYNQGGKEQAA